MKTYDLRHGSLLSGSTQIVQYQEAGVGGFDYIYICEAINPNAKLTDDARRIKRIKQVADGSGNYDGTLVNVSFARLGGLGCNEFKFKATDLAYCQGLSYNLA